MVTLEDFLKICNALNEEGVKYVIVGGWAVILHGLARATIDIDIIIDGEEENIKCLKKALVKFVKEEEIDELSLDLVKEYQIIRVGLNDFYIDIIGKIGDIDYKKMKDDMVIERIEDIEIPFAGLNTMIELKKGFRSIDIKDKLFLEGKKEFLEKG